MKCETGAKILVGKRWEEGQKMQRGQDIEHGRGVVNLSLN